MQPLGAYLKEQRVAKKVSLKEVAHSTNVTERYLDSIEKGEFDKVPEGPYLKGYISSYASAIGLDVHDTLERLQTCCREGNESDHIQQEIPEDKIEHKPLNLLLNNGKWLLLCTIILGLLTLGTYYFFSHDQESPVAIANLHKPEDKTRPETPTANLEKNVPPLNVVESTGVSNEQGNSQEDRALNQAPHRHSTLSRSKNHSPEEIEQEKRLYAKSEKSSGAMRPLPAVADEPKGEDGSAHSKHMQVLKAAVCTEVKHRNPSGRDDSLQWSTDRVYIWNLVKCEGTDSLIRHIYYFKGQKVSDITLHITPPLWRTWSYKSLADKHFIGPWRVDITS
ncbi:MAG: DUF2914 domain-containing protein, partial [Deltaproteobacteria bacterium]